jgi:hypothetical protein
VSIVDWYWVAADSSSAASRFHATDAARIGAEPGPEYILAELISGGIAPKSIVSKLGVDVHEWKRYGSAACDGVCVETEGIAILLSLCSDQSRPVVAVII